MRNTQRLILIAVILAAMAVSPSLSYDRVVLFELFTSATCGPCGPAVAQIDAFLEQIGFDHLVEVAYHMNWPGAGNDPFYLNNPGENTARRNFYGINAVPNLMCDGILGTNASSFQSYYNQRYNVIAPLDIELSTTIDDQINVSADITAESWYWGINLNLLFALTAIEYDIPPGSWTYTHFENGMLDMAPNAYGINFDITPSQTVTLETSFPIPSITTLDNLAVVAFVQDGYTNEVHQAKRQCVYPDISFDIYTIYDSQSGNGNGIAEPGEICDMSVTLINSASGAPALDISATLSTTDPGVTIIENQGAFPDLLSGGSSSNADDPFIFQVSPDFEPHLVTFNLSLTANNGGYTNVFNFTFTIGITPCLLVDDDGGNPYETNYLSDLINLGVDFNYWEVSTQGVPPGAYLANFEHIIWFTAMEDDPLVEAEQEALIYFLDRGGKLLISSENLGDDHGTTTFYTDYIHAEHEYNQVSNTILNGEPGDPISAGTILSIVGGAYWPNSQSTMIPDASAFPVYHYTNTAQSIGALRFDDEYALIYFAFPYECIHPNISPYIPRVELMENMLEWFDSLYLPAHLFFPDAEAEMDQHIAIPLFTSDISYENPILSYQIEVNWDPAVLEIDAPPYSIDNTLTPSDWTVDCDTSTPGTLSLDASGAASELTGIGTLIFINYHIIGMVEDYTGLTFASASFNQPLEVITHSGSLTIVGTGIAEPSENLTPDDFAIISVHPNPFNPLTTIELSVPIDGWVDAYVYNIIGERVALIHSGLMSKGNHSLQFDGSNLASGVYILRVSSTAGNDVRKLVLMK